jgi:hypothetical protein
MPTCAGLSRTTVLTLFGGVASMPSQVPYVVYEKEFPCKDYPSDGVVTFTNITAECDGKDCTKDIEWSPMVKGANCNMKANIISPTEISITWDTSAASRVDNFTRAELFDLNYNGWATKLNLERPAEEKVQV